MPGDSDEELRRVSSGWGRRPPTPKADPDAIERDTERARPTDEELARAGEAGAISGPATSREPSGTDPGDAPEAREG